MNFPQAHLQHCPPTKTSSFAGCEGWHGSFFPIAWHRRPSGRAAISSAPRPEGEARRGPGLHRAAAFPRCRGTSPPAVLPSSDGKGHAQPCARWPVPLPPRPFLHTIPSISPSFDLRHSTMTSCPTGGLGPAEHKAEALLPCRPLLLATPHPS